MDNISLSSLSSIPRKPVGGQPRYSTLDSNDEIFDTKNGPSQSRGLQVLPTYATINPAETSYNAGDSTNDRIFSEPSQSGRLQGAAPPSRRGKTSSLQWGISWQSPALMFSLFLSGIAFALGHNFYYASLDGTAFDDAQSQEWKIRYGTALAFLTKTCLAASVGIAYSQHIWTTFKKKSVSIGGINSIFAATHHLLSLFDIEMLRHAKIGWVLAFITWTLPLAVLITPATLSIRLNTVLTSRNSSVSTIDLGYAYSFAILGGQGDFASPQISVNRIAFVASIGQTIIPTTPPSGSSNNVSYATSFYGPSVKCDPPDASVRALLAPLNSSTSFVHPLSEYQCFAPQITNGQLDFPEAEALYEATSSGPDPEWSNQLWLALGGSQNLTSVCRLYNTSYSLTFNFTNGVQNLTVTDLKYINPVIYPDDVATSGWGTNGSLAAQEITYRALIATLGNIIVGEIGVGQGGIYAESTLLLNTAIINSAELISLAPPGTPVPLRNQTTSALIEELSQNITLSFFSTGTFLYNNTVPATFVNVTFSNSFIVYSYHSRNLWLAYGIGILASLFGVIVGVRAYIVNGIQYDDGFSAMLSTTRNPDLDDLAKDRWLGNQPSNSRMKKQKLQFGIISSSSDDRDVVGHPAFGLEGSVVTLRKGQSLSLDPARI